MKGSTGRTGAPAEFAVFRRQMNAQVSTLHDRLAPFLKDQIGKVEKAMSAKAGTTIRIEPGQTVPPGVFDEAENSIASAWLASNQYSVGNTTTFCTNVTISTATLVKEKVLVLSTTGRYRQASDIERYQDIA
jgi:hypothetical protein